MPKPLPPDHPAFGPFLAVRRMPTLDRIVWSVLIFLLGFLGLGFSIGGIVLLVGGDPRAAAMAIIGPIFLAVAAVAAHRALRVVTFYHHGAVARVLGRSREFPFAGATSLTYIRQRHYVEGVVYGGTSVSLRIKTADGRWFRYSGRHKERAKGLSAVGIGADFTGDDELDLVRDVAAAYVAQHLLARLDAGENALAWTNAAVITADGLLLRRMFGQPRRVPWRAIRSIEPSPGRRGAVSHAVHVHGEDRPAGYLLNASPGFYPGLRVVESLAARASADEEPTPPTAHGITATAT